jgi:hypothetical protein
MTAIMKTFRGTWRVGVYYHAGDIAARGPWSFEATVDHLAGTQSEPNSGADWASYWKPTDGVALAGSTPIAPQQQVTVIPFPIPYGAHPSPVPVGPSVSPAPVMTAPQPAPLSVPPLAPPAQLPAVIPPPAPRSLAASEIVDDSQDGNLNVAFALDALRKQIQHSVRQDDLPALLEQIIARLEGREPNVLPAPDDVDPVTAEAWRRKCEILQAPTIAAADKQINGMTREMVRLLRKRDKGGAFTPLEASRIAILDMLDQHLADIDARAADLSLTTPPDITADRHWPQFGSPS